MLYRSRLTTSQTSISWLSKAWSGFWFLYGTSLFFSTIDTWTIWYGTETSLVSAIIVLYVFEETCIKGFNNPSPAGWGIIFITFRSMWTGSIFLSSGCIPSLSRRSPKKEMRYTWVSYLSLIPKAFHAKIYSELYTKYDLAVRNASPQSHFDKLLLLIILFTTSMRVRFAFQYSILLKSTRHGITSNNITFLWISCKRTNLLTDYHIFCNILYPCPI